jgi:hypothetical protein
MFDRVFKQATVGGCLSHCLQFFKLVRLVFDENRTPWVGRSSNFAFSYRVVRNNRSSGLHRFLVIVLYRVIHWGVNSFLVLLLSFEEVLLFVFGWIRNAKEKK